MCEITFCKDFSFEIDDLFYLYGSHRRCETFQKKKSRWWEAEVINDNLFQYLKFIAGYSHQPPSYFQSNRKVPMTSNIYTSPISSVNYAMNTYHNILRLPSIPQLSPNNEGGSLYNNLKKDCEKSVISSNGNSSIKRKRSWSRAVFSNLQRKGLER